MEKNILRQYDSIIKEIEETQRRIQSANDKLKRIETEGTLIDSVSGGDGGKQHYRIEGVASSEYNMLNTLLKARIARLGFLKEKLMDVKEKTERYIMTIDESETRRIASFRFINNMSWKKVAENMGEGYTADACRVSLDRYIKKNN